MVGTGIASVIGRQYPHYLYVQQSEAATKAPNGDLIPGRTEWKLWSQCREETNGKGSEITTSDMKTYRFASLVQLPVGVARVPEGAMCLVTNAKIRCESGIAWAIQTLQENGIARIAAKCAKFDQGRLHCRLWL